MNIYAVSGLINAVLVSVLGVFVYRKSAVRNLNRKYAVFCFLVAFWSYSYSFWQNSTTSEAALFWCRSLMAGAIFIPLAFFHFIVSFLNVYQEKKKALKFGYIIFIFFLFLDFTPLFIKGVSPKLSFDFWPYPGIAFTPFILIWLGYCFYPCFLLFKAYKGSSGLKRNQIKYLLLGILVGYTSGSTNYFLWYNIPVLPFGNFIVPLFVALMAYSILKYHLMDIKIALTRAGLIFLIYSLVLGLPFWLGSRMLDQNYWWLPVIFMGVLATGGPFIYSYLRRKTENIILQNQKRYQSSLKAFSSTLIFIRDVDTLAEKVVSEIMCSVKMNFCALYLKEGEAFSLKSEKSTDHTQLPSKIEGNSRFIDSVKSVNAPVLGEYLPPFGNVKLGLISPLFFNRKIDGFIVLGSKEKHVMFTDTDVDVFSIVSNQTSLALSEIYYFKQYQKTIEEKFKLLVEKGRLESAFQISEAYRHELGNIINIISVSLANLSFEGGYEPTKEEIEQAATSISGNIRRAQRVFNAISQYNENSKSEFREIRLSDILNNIIEEHKEALAKYGINLRSDIDKNIILSANKNFIFALRYLLEGAIGAIEYVNPGNKLIELKLERRDSMANLKISDTGKDATADKAYKGVGLARAKDGGIRYFIARRIIFDHQGIFQMNSFYDGKGTIFDIKVPLLKRGE
ncbi:MAG: histidine kinase N-terminal 7TM domain-containing protein [Candidatus Omnitrophica bacterium]|nr:histidine kinase N-terminal 7TM domain-containing protein [Candidatus Omnitrophota bacterium]